jgi:hypothetical protein
MMKRKRYSCSYKLKAIPQHPHQARMRTHTHTKREGIDIPTFTSCFFFTFGTVSIVTSGSKFYTSNKRIMNMKCIKKPLELVKMRHMNMRNQGLRCSTFWLIVGCSQPVLIAFIVAMASNPPAAPRPCPIID